MGDALVWGDGLFRDTGRSGAESVQNRGIGSANVKRPLHRPVSHTRSSPYQIIPHPLAQSASAPGSRKIFYDSLFSTLWLAALIEWETEIRQAGEDVYMYLENYENNALRFSHDFAVDFETLKLFRRYTSDKSSHKVVR